MQMKNVNPGMIVRVKDDNMSFWRYLNGKVGTVDSIQLPHSAYVEIDGVVEWGLVEDLTMKDRIGKPYGKPK